LTSGLITLYRVTNPGDGISVTDKIIFNNSKNTGIENAFITGVKIVPSEGIGENQAPGQDLSDYQPVGRFEKVYELTGFISLVKGTGGDGLNAFVTTLEKWERESKNNDNFAEGRMGIQIDDMRKYDIVPSGTGTNQIGLLLQTIQWDLNWERKVPRVMIVIPLVTSRGDGT